MVLSYLAQHKNISSNDIKKHKYILDINPLLEKAIYLSANEGDEEFLSLFNEYIEFLFNYADKDVNVYNLNRLYKTLNIIKCASKYITDKSFLKLLNMITIDNLFVILYNTRHSGKSYKILIMNDVTMKNSKNIELSNFCFYEEDFWSLIEQDYYKIMNHFGGLNVRRKVQNKFQKLYFLGRINLVSKNMPRKSNSSKPPKVKFKLSEIKEVYGYYDSISKLETIMYDGYKIEDTIQLFNYVEDYNLANIILFAVYQAIKFNNNNNPDVIFDDSNLPIDFSLSSYEYVY